ncbi:toxin [Pasteurellaceae bacterium LFhippo2]|nr:toxin [Pasteurellaceae bacterium LFhippo2]
MNLLFIELSFFAKYRAENLTDEEYRALQNELLENPEKGEVMQGLSGLRKLRIADSKRQKGKRGGARVIYYYFSMKETIYFFTAYGKNEMEDLNTEQRNILKSIVDLIKNKEG